MSPTGPIGTTDAQRRRTGRVAGRFGWALTAALVAFLLFDSVTKIIPVYVGVLVRVALLLRSRALRRLVRAGS